MSKAAKFLSAGQVAQIMGVSAGHIKNMMDSGLIPWVPMGTRKCIPAWWPAEHITSEFVGGKEDRDKTLEMIKEQKS